VAQKFGPSHWEKLARNNRGSFQPHCREIPWVRYRFDVDENKPKAPVALLKLAIETNLGVNTRGTQYSESILPQRPEEDAEISPYAARNDIELYEACDGRVELPGIPTEEGEIPVEITIHFVRPGGVNPIDVDLIVDLGNTRTAAVLLEAPGQGGSPLDRRIYPLRILPRGSQFKVFTPTKAVSDKDLPSLLDDCSIIESWLLLHDSLFAHLEPPSEKAQGFVRYDEVPGNAGQTLYRERRYLPQAFVELSPALIGGGKSTEGAAYILGYATLEKGAPFFLSSPKRYAWDDQPQGEQGAFWFAIPNEHSDEFQRGETQVPLRGLSRYFMEPGGEDWSPEQKSYPFPEANPTYPRQAAVCWYALSLIEAAYRQINDAGYRRLTGNPILPRRLRWIRVTFPAGWTNEEKNLYLGQWERAIKLFNLTHLEIGRGNAPEYPALARNMMDEAVCSQLPIIYAQVQTLMHQGKTWIDLYGNNDTLIVMNLDIGGGTTDMSVIEYKQSRANQGVALSCKLLFRFGHAIAGDMVVKEVIEKVLLPAWLKAADKGQYQKDPRASDALKTLFSNPSFAVIKDVDPFMGRKLARITRLVLAPLATRLLQKMTERDEEATMTWEPLDIKACLEASLIQAATLDDLNDRCKATIRRYCQMEPEEPVPDPFAGDARVICRPEDIDQCIRNVFSSMFDNLGLLAARFKCHLVIVSGKPSELPLVRKLIDQAFPVMPQRIMTVKNFPAGRWYPFATADGRIQDAKTCTVVGAALYQEILNGNLPNFGISAANPDKPSAQYWWGIIPVGGRMAGFYKPPKLLFSPRDYREAEKTKDGQIEVIKTFENVPLNCRIGRQIAKLMDVPPDPVYKLDWTPRNPQSRSGDPPTATVTLKWVSVAGEGEHLELVNVVPENGAAISPLEVKLKLNTMLSQDFWMDSPEFDTSNFFAYLKRQSK
jgi:hypothetical protein